MKKILVAIVAAQFCATSVWFASNAIMPEIIKSHGLQPGYLAHLTSAVQLGFILGTLVYALLTIADRFSPSRVFFYSAVVASFFNLAVSMDEAPAAGLLFFRFGTGFFLAGIYPVGMKIASDHYKEGLGRSLGFLVGALVLGTAFPHLLKSMGAGLPWKYVVFATSALALAGGLLLVALVPDGPYRRQGQRLQFNAFAAGFKNNSFRAAAFGYFGHMWELYAFWAFVPLMLIAFQQHNPQVAVNVPLFSFGIIAAGGLACVASGLLTQKFRAKNMAAVLLFSSGLCWLLSPFFLGQGSLLVLLLFLFFWGLVVIADSPLFSTLVAQHAPAASRGTSLTIVNCIGFSITIISIQLLNSLLSAANAQYLYMLLAIGPALGLVALLRNK
ncbi:MAG: MFS transporter [Chitinophagaceae bacterium]